MSKTIDQKVVEMRFDNKQFENGVQESLSSLDKLKKGLDLEGASKGLTNMGSAVEAVQMKFSALEVMAVTALANITNSVVNLGKQLLNSLAIAPISQGFEEYELKMNSIQTIMMGTGASLEKVNRYLDELNTYADKTIYSFSDMTTNIGKFTNAGVDLEKAVLAIQGVSNEAALSGANANEASRAMYNFAQALSSGVVRLIDWKSIENANMATVEFKTQLLETAAAVGTVTKTSDGMYQVLTKNANGSSMKGALSATMNFNDSLAYQWMTTEVLIETLGRYADETTEIGKKAFAAAQDVKTFHQLMDTLSEAVGSGWAMTWEILFGDFEEAKALWTGISNVVGGFIDAQSKARNELLQGWKDLGGRTALIEAFKNAFEGLASVFKPIAQAFRDIFPATTAERLFSLTEKFREFTSHLKLSDEASANLRSTFKGLFAVLDIIKQAFSALFTAIKPIFSALGSLGGGILSVTGCIGEGLVKLDELIKQGGVFTTVAQGIAKVLETIFGAIGYVVTKIKENFRFPSFELFYVLLERIRTRISQIKEEAGGMKNAIGNAFDKIGETLKNSKFLQLLQAIWNAIKTIAAGIAHVLGNIFGTIIEKLGNADFNGILDLIGGLSFGGIAIAISKFLKSVTEPLEGLTGIFDSIKGMFSGVVGILDSVRGCFEAYQTQLKAGTLMKIAAAIAVLTGSIVVLALIDSDKLVASLAAMGVMFTELMAGMAVASRISGKLTGMIKTTTMMIGVAAAVLILASALKKVASLDIKQLATGLAGVAGLTAIVVVAAKAMSSGSKTVIKGAVSMLIFAGAIKSLASVCEQLSRLSWNELVRGLTGVGVLLAEVSLFLNTAKLSGKAITTATGIVLLAAAMKILASACGDFGQMSVGEIVKGLTSIGVLLMEIAAFTNLTGNAKHVMSTGISLTIIGAAMKIFASAVSDFGGMDWENLAKGLIAMGVAFAEVTAAVNLMPKNMIGIGTGLVIVGAALEIVANVLGKMGSMEWESIAKGLVSLGGALTAVTVAVKLMPKNMVGIGTGLVIVGAALEIVANVLKKMGGMSWENIAKGLVALGGAMVELAIGLKLMKGTLSGSAALLVAANALLVLTPVLAILGAMKWTSIAKGLIAIAGAFTVIGVAGKVLGPIVPTILSLSGALALIGLGTLALGAGFMAAGAGLMMLAAGFTSLAVSGAAGATSFVASLTVIITGIVDLIPYIVKKLGEGIVMFIRVIAESASTIGEAFKVILLTLVDVLVECVPAIVDGILAVITSVLASLAQYAPQIIDSILTFIIGILEGLATHMPALVQAAINVIMAFFQGVTNALSGIDTTALLKGIAGIGILTGIMIALNAVKTMIPGAMVGVLGMAAVLAELTLILAAFGGLAQIPGLSWLVEEGGKLLEGVGVAIGSFVGGIAGGFMSGMSSQFPQIGSDLSAFMTNVQPFLDGVAKIDPAAMAGAKSLAEVILLLTGAEVLDGIASWFSGSSSFSDFADEITIFGEAIVAYSEIVSGNVDSAAVESSANAGKALAELANNLPNSGGLAGVFAGENDIDQFAEKIIPFGEAIVAYSDVVAGKVNENAVQASANAGMMLTDLANNLPNSGGLAGVFAGENDIDVFAEKIIPFGEAIVAYSKVVDGSVDESAVEASANAGRMLADLAKTLPNSGGVAGFFAGENDIDDFAEKIIPFGEAIAKYSKTVAGKVDAEAVTASAAAGKALAELASTLPNSGGVAGFFAGENDINTFGENLAVFGEKFAEYSGYMEKVKPDIVNATTSAATSILELQNSLPKNGPLSDNTTLSSFGKDVASFGSAFGKYYEHISKVSPELLSGVVTNMHALADVAKEIQGVDMAAFKELGSSFGGTSFASFAEGIISFGKAMVEYSDVVAGNVDSEAVAASVNAGTILVELSRILPDTGGLSGVFGGETDVGKFAEVITAFGEAIVDYSNAVADSVDESAVQASANAGRILVDLARYLPTSGGLAGIFGGEPDVGKFAETISAFGKAIVGYSKAVDGSVSESAVQASANAGMMLVDLARYLPTSGGLVGIFGSEADVNQFSAVITTFGGAVVDYSKKVADGVDEGAVQASANAGMILIDLAHNLPSSGGLTGIFGGETNIDQFAEVITTFGSAIVDYSQAVAGKVDTDAVTASTAAGQALTELVSSFPSGGVGVLGDKSSIGTFGENLVTFGEKFAAYSGHMENVKADVVNTTTNVAASIVELQNSLPKAGGWFSDNTTLSSFGNDLETFGSYLSKFYEHISGATGGALDSVVKNMQALAGVANEIQGVNMNTFKEFGASLGGTCIDGFSSSFESAQSVIKEIGNHLSSYFNAGIRNNIATFTKSGQDAAQGFINGINSKMSSASNAGRLLGLAALDAAKKALDSHSPSKEFIYLGENIGEGLAIGINNSIVPAAEASSNMINEVISASKKGLDKFKDWVDEKNYYGELSLKDELAGWQRLQTMYKAGSDQRKEIDREVYRIQNELVAATYQASIDWIEEEKYYNRLSLEEELATYERIQARYMEGSEERKKADREVYRLRNELADAAYQHSLDWIEEEKYYNRLSLEDELAAYERVQARYMEGSEERKKADREVYRLRNELADAAYQHSLDWIEEEKYYNRLSLEDELAAYERMQARYVEGSEERKKIDREVYRLRNELVDAAYQHSLNWIEEEKYYNRLSLEDELAAYERMQARYVEGSEERKKIDREVYRLRNELVDASYQNSMNWIEEEMYYNRLSLADQLAAYKRVQSRYAKGTEERKKMDREVYRVEQEIYEAQKQYIEDIQRVQKEANEKRLELEEEYADKVTEINEKLARDIQSLSDQYENALKSREDSLYKSYGLFDAVTEKEEVSSETLMDNLEAQVKEFGEWQDILNRLSARGLDSELIEELQEMGPSAIAQIKALNNMSDSELEKYVSLWSVKHAQARAQAVGELEGLRIETQNNIIQLRREADRELEEYREVWQEKMEQVTAEANAELEQLKKDFGKQVGLIKENTEEELSEMVETAQKILREAGWDEAGQQIVTGLVEGVQSSRSALIDELTSMALASVEAVKDVLEINSPSRVFRELGNYSGLGFVNGLSSYADKSYDAGSDMAESAKDGLSNAIRMVADFMDNDIDLEPTIRPVLDLSNVSNGVDDLNSLLYSQRTFGLAGQASLAFGSSGSGGNTAIKIDNDSVVRELQSLRGDISTLAERMERMQIVLDSGALVGELAGPMDSALGRRMTYKGRGI